MKASKLIKILEQTIEKRGDVDVYIEAPCFNYEEVFSTSEGIGDCVRVENLDKWDKNLICEEHGGNTGLIWAVVLVGRDRIATYG